MNRYRYLLFTITLSFLLMSASTAEETGAIRFRYNDNNQLSEIVGPGKRKVELTYNSHGQIQTVDNGEEKQRYEYNLLGLLKNVNDHTGTTALRYDTNGRLQEMSYPQGDKVTYKYNENGGVTSVAWGDKHFLRYQRDLLGNPVKVETPVGDFRFQYDYTKGIMQRTYPNGATTLFQYNQEGRPILIQHATPDRRIFLELSYIYDDAGFLKTAIEKTPRGELSITYSYDAFGQLQHADYSDGRRYGYEYDSFGNRVKTSVPSGQITATYDKNDLLTSLNAQSVKHDAAGNVTEIGKAKFTYNVTDALTDDGTSRYAYNALGLRVEASGANGTSRFLHFIADLPYVLAETGTTTTRYIWADRQILGQIGDDNKPLFFFEDQIGSIRAAMDTAGNLVGYAEYAPFGEPVKRIAGVRFGFAGEEQDETGKVYLRVRYYLPGIGQFLSKDPVPPRLMDEEKQNYYSYVGNDPLNRLDPLGMEGQSLPQTYNVNTDWWKYNPIVPLSLMFTGSPVEHYLRAELYFSQLASPPSHEVELREIVSNIVSGSAELPKIVNTLSHPTIAQTINNIIVNSNPIIYSAFDKVNSYNNLKSELTNIITNRIPPSFQINPSYNPMSVIRSAATSLISNIIVPPAIPHTEPYFAPAPQQYWAPLPQKSQPPASVNTSVPSVGGIYLNKAADAIGDLSGIEKVTFDPITNRLLLVGTDKAHTKNLPPVRLDDLAAAFRSVFGNYDTEPGVTIDPNPQNPRADQMIVRFFGGMENTHFGMVLFEADRQMKTLSLGQDNLTKQKVAANIKDYHNMLDLGFSNLGGKYNKNLWSRFWLVPEQIPVKVSDDKTSITFPDTRIRVKTETMRWNQGQLIPAKGEKDEKAEYFAAHFTKYYDNYANEFPVYAELRQLTNMVGLAKWLKDTGIPVDLAWLKQHESNVQTPTKTPALTVSDERRFAQGNSIVTQQVSIFGGTDLTVNNAYLKDDGAASRAAQQARQAVAAQPGVASATFLDDHQQPKRVIALPTSQTRAAGAKMLSEDELALLGRVYCSFHNDKGQFGHSWFLDLPVLHISQPYRGKQEFLTVGKTKVLVQQFHLTRPFGMEDVRFEEHTVDQQYGRVAFLPDRRAGFRAIYPDNEKMEYRLEHDDGSATIFNAQGNIVRREFSPSDYLQYSYDSSGKLATIELNQRNTVVKRVALTYNDKGYITSATMPEETIIYAYDVNDDLVKVTSKARTVGYTYDPRHLVTNIQVNGNLAATFAYDDFGRVVTEKEGNGNEAKTTITTVNGKIEMTEGTADARVTRVYDSGGKLLEIGDASGNRLKLAYHDFGSPKVMQYTNPFGDNTTLEYSADGRQIVATDPERNSRALVLDEFGRVRQIVENGATVLRTEYGMTDQGWLESTETPGITVQTISNPDRTPARYFLNSKTSQGGQLLVTNEYKPNGLLQRQVMQGLMQGERVYQDGRVIKQTVGDTTTTFSYNNAGQLQEVASNSSRSKYSYDPKGMLQSLALRHGNMDAVYQFKNGQLVERQNDKGLKDAFQYDSEGVLQSVQRNGDPQHGGEQWDIRRDKRSLKYLRNGVLQVEFLLDEKDRLIEMIH